MDAFSSDNPYLIFAALLGACALLAVWSNATKDTPDELIPNFGQRASGVFFPVALKAGDKSGSGHVTTLGTHAATLLADLPLERGATVELDLSKLPDFEGELRLKATVRHVKRLRRSKSAKISMRVHFEDLGAAASPLATYVSQLGAASRLSHA